MKNQPRKKTTSRKVVADRSASKKVAEKKNSSAPSTVEDYLRNTAEPARSTLQHVRRVIRSVMPVGATEVISYRIPAFRHERMLVWYAAFPTHCSIFPGSSVIEAFREELKGYPTSKGTIQFPIDDPLPDALLKRLVKARLAESRRAK